MSEPRFSEADVELVSERMRLWSEALAGLAEPQLCREFLEALDTGDGDRFRELMSRWRLPMVAGCLEIAETATRIVHTGDYEATEVCAFAQVLRPLVPSPTDGRGYRMPDGTVLWLTEAQWWQWYDQAVADQRWRDANHAALVAVGIMSCHLELRPTILRVDVTKRYTICTPGWDPRAGRRS
jgi:hypothetical protein